MTDNMIRLYVVDSTGSFEEIQNKVNASLAQFNIRIETNTPENLKY